MIKIVTSGDYVQLKYVDTIEEYVQEELKSDSDAVECSYGSNGRIYLKFGRMTFDYADPTEFEIDGDTVTSASDFVSKFNALFSFSGGSGGVESVTGDLVDNTDPNNPIINTPSAPYLLYKGEITQASNKTSGLLTIGQRYTIDTLQAGDNFTNVGYLSEQVEFVATGTTPTTWTHSTVVIPSPVLTTIYNSYNSTPYVSRSSIGLYHIVSPDSEFTNNKTFAPPFGGRQQIANMPIFGETNGYYELYGANNNSFINLSNASDTSGTPVEMNAIVGNSQFKLFVHIETYP